MRKHASSIHKGFFVKTNRQTKLFLCVFSSTHSYGHMLCDLNHCKKCTLKTSLTAVISSGPTPSPGTMVTLKVASARAGGASGAHRLADTLSGREASCCHRGLLRPWGKKTRSQQTQHGVPWEEIQRYTQSFFHIVVGVPSLSVGLMIVIFWLVSVCTFLWEESNSVYFSKRPEEAFHEKKAASGENLDKNKHNLD